MVNDSHRLHSRQVVGGFPGAAANSLLEKEQPPPQMPVVVDTEREQKGQSIMDVLLGLCTTEENAVGGFPDAAANGLLEEQQPPPLMPAVVDTEREQKGQSIMDALLGMFTTKVNAEEKDNSSGSLASATATSRSGAASPEQLPTPTSPH